ncbi:MAG: hypothetical protein OXG51_13420 [Gammaproteobacteria bacterium]|nr:hypothetical protein [Gammaproteobacteria bacterium]
MDPRRTQILNDMGIEAWRLRSAEPAAAPSRPKREVPVEARAPAALPRRTARSSSPQPGNQPAPHPTEPARQGSTDLSTGDSFSVIAFCAASQGGGALLACGSLSGRGQAVLAADIVRCLCRNWAATVRRIEFKWPLPGVSGAAGPALDAFLDKQIDDFSVTRALATASAAAKLPPDGIDFITIPDLAELDSPDAKRALWRQMQEPALRA